MADPRVSVRRAGPDDWEAWRDLRLRSLAADPDAFGSTFAREQVFGEETWRERLSGLSVIGAFDGTPAALGGAFEFRPGFMQVVAMWTDPAYRGLGLASSVLDLVVRSATAAGHRVVLEVARGNDRARAVYERYGFVATGQSEPIRPGAEELCDWMALPDLETRRS
ncbi:GNAT family N-acetyltransferase [Nocardioides guangzhouensis]|uniref:GNAT family N-acetyltransferase n=1 Tax=Nocardioides guangzhouensis TaxID=2497878 RepID=A0A4Q4ZES9_9ACTN|nr:GNAT family N-acetyltransferase [Nocardioides guangzhouensis]RYP85906.1 GNAT family N-acetyltransferase [Nocardioides guangzhouensis]